MDKPSLERITTCCTSVLQGDDLVMKFWEVEERVPHQPAVSIEERTTQEYFDTTHTKDENGRFIVPLPQKENVDPLGDSQALAVKRFLSLERSLKASNNSHDFTEAVREYLDMGHAEPVPACDLEMSKESYYMPMHVVMKESSATKTMGVVFDASTESMLETSLNDHLLVGPTVHLSLVDIAMVSAS